MIEYSDVSISTLTTLRLGGPARRLLEAASADEVVEAVKRTDASDERLLVMGGGSNLVVADDGFDGTLLRIGTRGIALSSGDGDRTEVTVQAGEPWDEFVAFCVERGLAGVECLAGIPGATGATPIQNVGAYGEDVAQTITRVRVYDRSAGAVVELASSECAFAYRSSALRHSDRYVVLAVTFELEESQAARSIQYAELARVLGVELGDRPPLREVREAVLGLRRNKGMVIDPADSDSVSAGSFFVNPILSADEFAALGERVAARAGATAVSAASAGVTGRSGGGGPPRGGGNVRARPPAWPEPDGRIKTSAAWLIEQAGFHRGYGNGRVAISGKHTLALVNRGGASTADLLALAREVRDGVRRAFGVSLRPEPTLVGVEF